MIELLESPRDAMQGLSRFIPTEQKVNYLNTLLQVGFDMLDFGSFVSPKYIPQMRDSRDVIEKLETEDTNTKIVSTVGNYKWATQALMHEKIDIVAFPFSISESFLKKNINSDFKKSIQSVDQILNLCRTKNKGLKIYMSMAFGNPYGDQWSIDILSDWIGKLIEMGIDDIVLADTTGDGSSEKIAKSFKRMQFEFPSINFGVHLHTSPQDWHSKLSAAYESGCRRFDSVVGGLGGCPMSNKSLIGNLDTSNLLSFLKEQQVEYKINRVAYEQARLISSKIFG